jgi:hypothetical protein
VEPLRALGIDWSDVEPIRGSQSGWPAAVGAAPVAEDASCDEQHFFDICLLLAGLINVGLEDCGVGLYSLTLLAARPLS